MTARMKDRRFSSSLGIRLRDLRKKQGLSPSELARKAYVPARDVYRVEKGRGAYVSVLRRFAEVLGVAPGDLIQETDREWPASVFLSYGSPDEDTARAFYRAFKRRGIKCFFFPESAIPGVRLHRTMSQGVVKHNRFVLICSRASLTRRGVLYEIEQVLGLEAKAGGAELLVPVTLDDYVFERWSPQRPDLADQVRSRVIADFRKVTLGSRRWRREIAQLVAAVTT